MSKNTPATPELTAPESNGATGAPDASTLDDFFSAVPHPQEKALIGGRWCYFEGGSAEDKDKLIANHSRDDGMGNVSVEQKRWRTNVIAMAWRQTFGGPRMLATPADADRFYTMIPAAIEMEMYKVAARVSGLADVEERRKNSDAGGGTATSRMSASTTSTSAPGRF